MRALAANSSPGLTSAVQGTHRGDGAFNCNWYTEEKIGHHNNYSRALTTNHLIINKLAPQLVAAAPGLFTSALKVEIPVASYLNCIICYERTRNRLE